MLDGELLEIIRCEAHVLRLACGYRDALFALQIAWSDVAAQRDMLFRRGTVPDVRRYADLCLVVRWETAAHPWVVHYCLASHGNVATAWNAIQTAWNVGHPVPSCTSKIAWRTCHSVWPFVGAGLFLISIVDEYRHGLCLTRLVIVRHVEARAHHVPFNVACGLLSSRHLMSVEPEVGIAVCVVEA